MHAFGEKIRDCIQPLLQSYMSPNERKLYDTVIYVLEHFDIADKCVRYPGSHEEHLRRWLDSLPTTEIRHLMSIYIQETDNAKGDISEKQESSEN
jgi:hypothetical protein